MDIYPLRQTVKKKYFKQIDRDLNANASGAEDEIQMMVEARNIKDHPEKGQRGVKLLRENEKDWACSTALLSTAGSNSGAKMHFRNLKNEGLIHRASLQLSIRPVPGDADQKMD
uniref:Uncharacterized protein n=1 Tax=Oryza barthii TaxID=65489 RepID=A0A0D3G1Y4_9ORYZ